MLTSDTEICLVLFTLIKADLPEIPLNYGKHNETWNLIIKATSLSLTLHYHLCWITCSHANRMHTCTHVKILLQFALTHKGILLSRIHVNYETIRLHISALSYNNMHANHKSSLDIHCRFVCFATQISRIRVKLWWLVEKLELCRAHTPRTPCICIRDERSSSMHIVSVDDLDKASCTHEQKAHAWLVVGMVDRRGYGGQQKWTIVTLVGSTKRSEAYWSHFFTKFDWFRIRMSCSGA
jgi:hypothetical protein